jgi:hypothetical protein
MDKRKNYLMVIDTETAPLDKEREDVCPYNMAVYDVGFAIVDKYGEVYKTASFVNADIFLDEKELMKSSYYAKKIPQYWEDIKSGKRILTSWYNIRKAVADAIKEYNVSLVFAHNMRFDYGATNNTQRWLTKSKYRFFFPYGVTICDTLKMSRQVIGTMPTYKNYCERNGYLTKTGQPRLTAEIIYRFITGDENFTESHTGLEDVLIEKEILRYCYSKHKKMIKELWSD